MLHHVNNKLHYVQIVLEKKNEIDEIPNWYEI